MLSSLSPSSPIRSKLLTNSSNYHPMMKVGAPHPSPQSVQELPYGGGCTPKTATTNASGTTKKTVVEEQVSFRTATRRFSCNATGTVSSPTPMKQYLVSQPPKTTGTTIRKSKLEIRHRSTDQPSLPTISLFENERFPLPTTKTFVPSSPMTKVNHLSNNIVFQKRYNMAATTIQRIYRGRLHRTAVVRLITESTCATTIQTVFRGHFTRLRTRVYQLEHQLRQIEQQRVRDLQEIHQKTENEIQRMNEKIGHEHVKYMQRTQKLQDRIDEANHIITYIRKENKKIRDKNDALYVAIQQLVEENAMLERQAGAYQEFASNMDDMLVLDHENVALSTIMTQFDERRQQFEDAIGRRDEFIMYENQMGRLYLQQIQQMVLLLEATCTDPYLVAFVEDLCIKCNCPGTGLESDYRMDMSER